MGNVSVEFLGFAVCVVFFFHLAASVFWRKLVLLASSIFFLSTFTQDPLAFAPFAAFVLLGYAGVRLIGTQPEKWFAPVAWSTLLLFVWIKKYTFIPSPLFLGFSYTTIGLSYILFRILHLMIQVRYGTLTQPVNLILYLCYTINFLTLVSGPIQKYDEFVEGIERPGRLPVGWVDIGCGLERIIRGYFKTTVMALLFSSMQSSSLVSMTPLFNSRVWYGILVFASYPFFLYCNFSGYIDVVIGLGRLMGLTLPENFDRPFSADSFIGFWNKWHITLSEWLRSSVYTPLLMGLMRRYPAKGLENTWAIVAFFTTFFLIGIWHGQTATFVFFGFLQGLGVSLNKIYQLRMTAWLGRKGYKALSANPLYIAVSRGLTFTWFAFTLIWFWSNWGQILELGGKLRWDAWLTIWLSIFVLATVGLEVWERGRAAILSVRVQGESLVLSRYCRTAWNTGLVVVTAAMALLSNQPPPDIVYKTF